jgi:hypothetical protein
MSVLVDTRIWQTFFRRRTSVITRRLDGLIERDELVIHPFVVGECALQAAWERVRA